MKSVLGVIFACLLLGTSALALPRGGSSTSGGSVTPTGISLAANGSSATVVSTFDSNTANAPVGDVSVTASGGSFSGTLGFAIAPQTGCTSGTDSGNSAFQIVGGTLKASAAQLPSSITGSAYSICLSASQSGTTIYHSFSITGLEKPGVSAGLYGAPYYSCVVNYYVDPAGSNANDGLAPTTGGGHGPWLTIAHADALTRTAGDCINVAAGTYTSGNTNLTQGGSSATSTGYVVYRCSTLNACNITNTNGAFIAGNTTHVWPSYLIFDGFNAASATFTTAFAKGFDCENTTNSNIGCHHWVVINNIISGFGQAGIQLNEGEYIYMNHNKIVNSAQSCTAAQGSGISYLGARVIPAYSPTADDLANPKFSILGSNSPFRISAQWNNISNSFIGCTSGNSDGNGIISDSNFGNGTAVPYTQQAIIANNVVYNNGGRGIWVFFSVNTTMANNSCYNNDLDLFDSGTARPCIGTQNAFGDIAINNLTSAIVGAGVLANNNGIGLSGTAAQTAEVGSTNLTKCSNGSTPCAYFFPQGSLGTWSCVTNKCNSDPGWADVGRTSAGTESTQPISVNFALCTGTGTPNAGCSGTSAAIGYGATQSYLSAQAADAGACDHRYLACP